MDIFHAILAKLFKGMSQANIPFILLGLNFASVHANTLKLFI